MSTVLGEGSLVHRPWHDLESLFWILVFVTLRHVRGATYNGKPLRNHRDKEQAMNEVFNEGKSLEGVMEALSKSKLSFLQNATLGISGDIGLQRAIETMKSQFSTVYQSFLAIKTMKNVLDQLAKSLDPNFKPEKTSSYSECESKSQLLEIMTSIQSRGETLAKGLQVMGPSAAEDQIDLLEQLQKAKKILGFAMEQLEFPTYESMRTILEKAIRRATGHSAAIPYIAPKKVTADDVISQGARRLSKLAHKLSSATRWSLKRKTEDEE